MSTGSVPPSGRKRVSLPRDTILVTEHGGRIRKHKYWRDLGTFIVPMLIAIIAQAAVYVSLMARAGVGDWGSISLAIIGLSLVPFFSAVILAAFRQHDVPVVVSLLVVSVLYSVVITIFSGFRVPMSYTIIAACLPIGIGIMAYANIRFHRTITMRVALASFDKADEVVHQIGAVVPILTNPDADISGLDLLLIDPDTHHNERWSGLLSQCYLGGVEILPWARFMELRQGRLHIPTFNVSHIAYTPSQLLYARAKRGLDLFAVLVTLPVTVVLAILVAGYIYLRDGGPVIFVQLRRGLGGARFKMYKFRTMYRGTSGGATTTGDNRIIPGCALLRKLRLDELPQLYNIAIGDMTLIGPRPVAVYIARQTEKIEPKFALRCLVKPGITGWAQVTSGYAGTVEQEIEKLSYDLYYIKHLSFDLDTLIVFKTIRTVLFRKGAL